MCVCVCAGGWVGGCSGMCGVCMHVCLHSNLRDSHRHAVHSHKSLNSSRFGGVY